MDKIKVRKRDGSLEPFKREKTIESMEAAGASPEAAESITSEVEEWLIKAATNKIVQSSAIRKRVLELLRPQDPKAALNFERYKK